MRAEEVDREDHPQDRDHDVEHPGQLGVLLALGVAGDERERRGHDQQLPAPEVDRREGVAEEPRLQQPLHRVVGAAEDHVADEREDHRVRVERPEPAEGEVRAPGSAPARRAWPRSGRPRACRPRPTRRRRGRTAAGFDHRSARCRSSVFHPLGIRSPGPPVLTCRPPRALRADAPHGGSTGGAGGAGEHAQGTPVDANGTVAGKLDLASPVFPSRVGACRTVPQQHARDPQEIGRMRLRPRRGFSAGCRRTGGAPARACHPPHRQVEAGAASGTSHVQMLTTDPYGRVRRRGGFRRGTGPPWPAGHPGPAFRWAGTHGSPSSR